MTSGSTKVLEDMKTYHEALLAKIDEIDKKNEKRFETLMQAINFIDQRTVEILQRPATAKATKASGGSKAAPKEGGETLQKTFSSNSMHWFRDLYAADDPRVKKWVTEDQIKEAKAAAKKTNKQGEALKREEATQLWNSHIKGNETKAEPIKAAYQAAKQDFEKGNKSQATKDEDEKEENGKEKEESTEEPTEEPVTPKKATPKKAAASPAKKATPTKAAAASPAKKATPTKGKKKVEEEEPAEEESEEPEQEEEQDD